MTKRRSPEIDKAIGILENPNDPKRVYKDQVSLIDDSVLMPPPSCAPKKSKKVSQYNAEFEIAPELKALGFIRMNITAMSTKYADSAINICMDNLKEPSSLATLTVLIKKLGFIPSNISSMLYGKSAKITEITRELDNIKSLINSEETKIEAQLKVNGITSAIHQCARKKGKDKAEIPSVIKDLMAKKGLTYIEPPQLKEDSPASAKSSSKSKLQKAKPSLMKKHKESKEDSDATESDEPHESDSSDESYSSSSSSAKAKSKAKPKPKSTTKTKAKPERASAAEYNSDNDDESHQKEDELGQYSQQYRQQQIPNEEAQMSNSSEYRYYQSSSSSSASYLLSSSSQSQKGYYAASLIPRHEEVDDHMDPTFNIEATPAHSQYMASTPVHISYMASTPAHCDPDSDGEHPIQDIALTPAGDLKDFSFGDI